MNPWQFFWAPQLHFPFGGSVAQHIQPNTSWFFDSIPVTAGDSSIEKKAFEIASYGRQLGLITEVLLDISRNLQPNTIQGQESLERLEIIYREIEALKVDDTAQLIQDIEAKITKLESKNINYPQLRFRLEKLSTKAD